MSTSAPHHDVRRALIVHAHPERESFSTSQAHAAAQQLQSLGVETTVLDLYAEGWDPVLAPHQFPDADSYFKPQAAQLAAVTNGTLQEPVRSHLSLVQEADLLILSFPMWWFSMPAILKGWVDRVFVMGAAFGGTYGFFDQGGMSGKKAMLLLTTGGPQDAYAPDAPDGLGSLDTFLFHIHRGMLEFCGYEVLAPVVTFAAAHLDGQSRLTALEQVQQKVSAAVQA